MAVLLKSIINEELGLLTKKEGTIRQNLLGKRVNRCARCVFTGDISLPLGVVGVPRSIAKILHRTVMVHAWNLSFLQGLLD